MRSGAVTRLIRSAPFRLPADAAKAAYTSLDETTVMGAVRFPEVWADFRKYKIKPGIYTLRLAIQPMDGDHMGTAPYNEFCLLAPAERDTKPDLMDPTELHELSFKATGRMGLDGPGLQALRELYAFHDLQRQSVSRSVYERAIVKTAQKVRGAAPELKVLGLSGFPC